MSGPFGLTSNNPSQAPLYGSPAQRDPLVSALMQKIGANQAMSPQPNMFGGMNPINIAQGIRNLQRPSNIIPGTGLFGTRIGGTPYAVGAAPGPNQIIPM